MKSSKAGRPLWNEGMLVCPQHLQHQDAYHEQQLDARFRAHFTAPWGLQSIEISPAALEEGILSVTHVSGVFPDGTIVNLPGESQAQPLTRNVSQRFGAQLDVMPVFLGVQILQGRASNVQRAEDPTARRFLQRKEVIHDLTSGKSRTVDVVDPHVAILLGDESQDDFAVVQIAEIERAAGARFALSTSFIPPLLAIRAAHNLTSEVQRLISRALLRRRRMLAERDAQGTVLSGLRQTDLNRALFIQGLDTCVPWIRACLADLNTSPHLLYRALLQLCGSLAYPTGEGDPHALQPYAASDLSATFQPLIELATRQLEAQFSRHYIELDLTVTRTHWHARDSRIRMCREVIFALAANGDRALIQKAVAAGGKAASLDRMKLLLPTAAPGIPITPLATPPVGVPSHPNEFFFRLDETNEFFKQVRQERDIALVLPPPLSPQHTPLRILGLLDEDADA